MALAQRIQPATIDDVVNANLPQNIRDYLECEKLINQFFSALNYCMPNCIRKKESKYTLISPVSVPGFLGCCNKDGEAMDISKHSKVVALLARLRIEKYGSGIPNLVSCHYHTKKGCVLETHKPPICVSYCCSPMEKHIHRKFDLGNMCFLTRVYSVLEGSCSKAELNEFKNRLQKYTEIVKSRKYTKRH